MSHPEHDRRVDYIEFLATDIPKTRAFYERAFGWTFTDYGDKYTSFEDGRMMGGFQHAESVPPGGPLVVLYATDLANMESRIREAGGEVVRAPFDFPGGRRFHFRDPGGNELAVWSQS